MCIRDSISLPPVLSNTFPAGKLLHFILKFIYRFCVMSVFPDTLRIITDMSPKTKTETQTKHTRVQAITVCVHVHARSHRCYLFFTRPLIATEPVFVILTFPILLFFFQLSEL